MRTNSTTRWSIRSAIACRNCWRRRSMRSAGPTFELAIDLGCGTGLMGERLRPFVDHLEGHDISAAMLKKARRARRLRPAGEIRPADASRYDGPKARPDHGRRRVHVCRRAWSASSRLSLRRCQATDYSPSRSSGTTARTITCCAKAAATRIRKTYVRRLLAANPASTCCPLRCDTIRMDRGAADRRADCGGAKVAASA